MVARNPRTRCFREWQSKGEVQRFPGTDYADHSILAIASCQIEREDTHCLVFEQIATNACRRIMMFPLGINQRFVEKQSNVYNTWRSVGNKIVLLPMTYHNPIWASSFPTYIGLLHLPFNFPYSQAKGLGQAESTREAPHPDSKDRIGRC